MARRNDAVLLEVKDHSVSFSNHEEMLQAVERMNYTVSQGQVLGIVGESGSGKTVQVMSMVGLLQTEGMCVEGEALWGGRNLIDMDAQELCGIRGREIGFIFQNPMSCLNPVTPIGKQISEAPIQHGLVHKGDGRLFSLDLLRKVGIPENRIDDYPHQFSGGERQRIMIAIAISCNPKLLICDEPTTALDVTVERKILDLLLQLRDERDLGIIMVTHNLSIAMDLCDDLVVMFAGNTMEKGTAYDLAKAPRHPYTKGLFGANLEIGRRGQPIGTIHGSGTELAWMPEGCPTRPLGTPLVSESRLIEVADQPGHWVNSLYVAAPGEDEE